MIPGRDPPGVAGAARVVLDDVERGGRPPTPAPGARDGNRLPHAREDGEWGAVGVWLGGGGEGTHCGAHGAHHVTVGARTTRGCTGLRLYVGHSRPAIMPRASPSPIHSPVPTRPCRKTRPPHLQVLVGVGQGRDPQQGQRRPWWSPASPLVGAASGTLGGSRVRSTAGRCDGCSLQPGGHCEGVRYGGVRVAVCTRAGVGVLGMTVLGDQCACAGVRWRG